MDSGMAREDVESLLREIDLESNNGDLGGFSKTITKALTLRVIHELAEGPSFWESVDRLVGTIRVEHDSAILMSLAELGRLSVSLKAKAKPVVRISSSLLQRRTPAHFSFGDGDQRYYAAIAWERSGHALLPEVAARTAVLEDTSDKARRTWLRLLIRECGVCGALRRLTSAAGDLQWLLLPGSSRSFDSPKERSRRIGLLLKALRTELNADVIEVDDGVVAALSDLVPAAFAYVSRPDRYLDAAKPAEEYMSLLLHLIRMKFRLLTDPAVYEAAVKTRRWLPDGGWRRLTSSSPVMERLRRTLIEGLVLLLKQGKVSRELADVHRQLSSGAQDAKRQLANVARDERDLAPEIRAWLETGEYGIEDDEIGLSDSDDRAIAVALLAAYELPQVDVRNLANALDEQSIPPKVVKRVQDLVNRSADLKSQVQSLAKRRSLSVFGEAGTKVEFSPHAHRAVDKAGSSRVTIIKPGVEATARRGSRVIVRAIVS